MSALTPRQQRFYEKVPPNGRGIMPEKLRAKLRCGEELFLATRNELIQGRWIESVQGGALRRTDLEEKLYDRIDKALREGGLKRLSSSVGRMLHDPLVSQVANQGRRATGGKWSRPDIVMVTLRQYDLLPHTELEVWAIEIKARGAAHPSCIAQVDAAAHGAHRACAFLHVWEDQASSALIEKCIQNAQARGVGLVIFEEPDVPKSWQVLAAAAPRHPELDATQQFLEQQLKGDAKDVIRGWLGRHEADSDSNGADAESL